MREFTEGPRRSGRTHSFIMSLPEVLEETDAIYIVAGTFHLAMMIKDRIKSLRTDIPPNCIRPYGVESIHLLRGVDPPNIYFEHTAYEFATVKQYREICLIENLQEKIWSKE